MDAQSNVVAVAAGASTSFAISGMTPERFDEVIVRLDRQLADMFQDLMQVEAAVRASPSSGGSATARLLVSEITHQILTVEHYLRMVHYLRLASMRGNGHNPRACRRRKHSTRARC